MTDRQSATKEDVINAGAPEIAEQMESAFSMSGKLFAVMPPRLVDGETEQDIICVGVCR